MTEPSPPRSEPEAPAKAGDATRTAGIIGGVVALLGAGAIALFSGDTKDPTKGEPAAAITTPADPGSLAQTPPAPAPALGVAETAAIPAPALAPPAKATPPAKPPVAAAPKAGASPDAGVQVRRVDGRAPANLEFIVKFSDGHPMAQAAELELGGKRRESSALAQRTLRSRADLAGLCLQGFTLGGEVVLELCQKIANSKVESAAKQWLRHIKGIRGVQYVDRNVTFDPTAAGGADEIVTLPNEVQR